MKKDAVPQQADAIYEGETKVLYAQDSDGKLTPTPTQGWEAEIDALKQAVDEIAQLAQDALARAHVGETSPLEYHMYQQRLDLPMLAQAMGRFQWQVRRHFDPKRFARLSDRQRERYARVLGLSPDELMQLPPLKDKDPTHD
ncbi:hypothetical protein [Hydrogenovibrio halophilus]|uniref:hypothetical protein n=1 Tax=Hydrogenovibrio halophilus TaxID=373391 RepID=UPI000373B816|nr:hypothetical protein [Hydrogenovibrio halophilus]